MRPTVALNWNKVFGVGGPTALELWLHTGGREQDETGIDATICS